eukprot:105174_1
MGNVSYMSKQPKAITKAQEAKKEVQKWLENDVKLPQYLDNFTRHGYESMAAVKTMDQEALEGIGIEKAGHQKQLLVAIATLNKDKISAEEINLSDNPKPTTPKLESTDTDTTDIRIQDERKVGGSTDVNAVYITDLNYEQGKKLIEISGLLWGFSLKKNGEIINTAGRIFELTDEKEFDMPSHFKAKNQGYSTTEISYNSVQEKTITSGYKNVQAGISGAYKGPFVDVDVSAQMSYSTEETHFSESTVQSSKLFAQGYYPRGTIALSARCLKLTQDFKDDFKRYVTDEMKEEAFRNLYGYWVTLHATVGGMAYVSKSVQYSKTKTKEDEKRDFSASFSAKVSTICGGANAKAKFGIEETKGQSKEAIDEANSMTLYSKGGENTVLTEDKWSNWSDTIETNWEQWAVIEVNQTNDLLTLDEFMPNEKKYFDTIATALQRKRDALQETGTGDVYAIRSKKTGQYLTVRDGDDKSVFVENWNFWKDPNQLFYWIKTDYGVSLKGKKSGKVLSWYSLSEQDITSGTLLSFSKAGMPTPSLKDMTTPIFQAAYRMSTDQLFQFVDLGKGDGSYRIDIGNGNEGHCLDAYPQVLGKDNRVGRVCNCKSNGGDNQIWYLVKKPN